MFSDRHHPLISSNGTSIYFQGPGLETGIQPAVLYFALSAHMSLFVDPFNQPVLHLSHQGIRVFSWDLPFHEADQDPNEALLKWGREFSKRPSFISDFISLCQENIHFLIQQGLVNIHSLAVAGLSRGGFIATHLAARDPRIKTVVGFAPLTHPQPFQETKSHSEFLASISLAALVNHLVHTHLLFFIGNRDMRVGTDACYHFIRALTEAAFAQGVRSPKVELIIYPSIGHKGHGTPSVIFHQGADWIKQQLCTLP